MLKERVSIRRERCSLITADFTAPVEAYALAYLKLLNNAREYTNMIYSVSNDRRNGVYVVCPLKATERVKEFLTGIEAWYDADNKKTIYVGKVTSVEEIDFGHFVYDVESTYHYDDPRWDEDIDKALSYYRIEDAI